MSEFDDIRPYRDNEVQEILKKTIADKEFIDLFGQLRFGRSYKICCWVLRPLLQLTLRRLMNAINTVGVFQAVIAKYLTKTIEKTTDGLNVYGADKLDMNQSYLFLSNHRDITMDPALTNYALYKAGSKTLRIAIGDNLLTKEFASDLMRLNKSFIVRRAISQPRKLLMELKRLSRYIWVSLKEDKQPVWIAHREGRAKNGWDKTDAAIIKMLAIAKPKDIGFSKYICALNIVPVSISYEYDPCDASKAQELKIVNRGDTYVKDEHEDLASIGKGIKGYKGKVDLVFGSPLRGEFNTAEEVASVLDTIIVRQYHLQASNIAAYQALYGGEAWELARSKLEASNMAEHFPDVAANDKRKLNTRLTGLDNTEKELLLTMYANPITHKLALLPAGAKHSN